jgi:uncharacterized protein YjbI with pentapeptide repeats
MLTRLAIAQRAALAALAGALLLASAALKTPPAKAGDVRLAHAIGGVCSDCDFSGRDLAGASVIGVLPRSIFSNAILTDARIGGNFSGASFARADLTGASVQSANFVNADFSGAKLDGARLSGANFYGARFTGATLINVRASWTNLSTANFLAAKLDGADLEAVDLSRSELTRAGLASAVLVHANLTAAQLEDANLESANLAGADATGAAFTGANLTKASFDDAILDGADLSGAVGLTSEAIAKACGDNRTKLPGGLSVPQCTMDRILASRAGLAPFPHWGFGDPRRPGAAWTFLRGSPPPPGPPLGPPGPSPLGPPLGSPPGVPGAPGPVSAKLEEARRAVSAAYAEAHAQLDLSVRDSILSAGAALAEVDTTDALGSDADVQAVIDGLERAEAEPCGPAVRADLERARASLQALLAETAGARQQLAGEPRSVLAAAFERERARRIDRLDGELAARDRQLDREIEARLRALQALCMRSLHEAEADAGTPQVAPASADAQPRTSASCRAGQQQLDAERDTRRKAIKDENDADRSRMDADLAALARQVGLIDLR